MRLLIVLACLVPTLTFAAPADPVAIGVLDLTGEKVPASDLRVLTDRLRAELIRTGRFRVMERERMAMILKEQGFQKSGCTSTECAVEMGQLMNVHKMVAGQVGKIGRVYSFSIRIIDVKTGEIERTAVKDSRASLEDVLMKDVAIVAGELAGLSVPVTVRSQERTGGFGMLFIESTPPGAEIILNGKAHTVKTPTLIRDLPAGEHTILIKKGNLIGDESVVVVRDDLTKVNLTLRAGKGSLFIQSTPSGAAVWMDGKRQGTTPLLIKNVDAGPCELKVTEDGYLPWADTATVRFGQRVNASATLKPCGWLTVETRLPDARIEVDGGQVGMRSLVKHPLEPGSHNIAISHPACETVRLTVEIRASETVTIGKSPVCPSASIQILSKLPDIRISSTPKGVEGTTPLIAGNVTPGTYTVIAERTDYRTQRRTVIVRPGERVNIVFALDRTPEAQHEALQMKRNRTAALIVTLGFVVILTMSFVFQ
jgi:hypothetical protein